MKLKHAISILCAVREAAKMAVVLAAILFINLPSAWAENGHPLLLVLLAMIGTGYMIRSLWQAVCWLDWAVFNGRKKLAAIEARRSAEYRREAEHIAHWNRFFEEQEREMRAEGIFDAIKGA